MLSPLPPEAPKPPALLLAYSGGLDSSVLLHLLANATATARGGLRAVHVHHGLHAQADAWAAHCERACAALGVPLQVVCVEVTHAGGEGLEAAARHARYAALHGLLQPGEILLTAHHREDQAETFLLRALRASGPDGLSAMRPWRGFAQGWHWRPLLDTPRSALQEYALRHALRWVDDPGNADTDFDRNFLRQRVLPLLAGRWPQAAASLARSAALSAEAAGLLADEDAQALAAASTPQAHTLSVPALLALPAARRARVLRRWTRQLRLPPLPASGLVHIETELLPARIDAEARFDWHGASIRRWRDLLHAGTVQPPLPPDWRQHWDGRLPLVLPDGGRLSLLGAAALPVPLLAHARAGGERITLPGRRHSTSLKNVLLQRRIPPWTREHLPLLSTADGELLAVADQVHAARFDRWLCEHRAHLRWDAAAETPLGQPPR